jgi:hypothetical protein
VKRIVASVIFLSFVFSLAGFGQVGVDYDLKKPARYEDRSLGYEKTTETKWSDSRALLQNTITQYNWYFNANNKLNEILVRAKGQFREDYTQLLPFYNYTLDVTSKDKRNLDSILDKVNSAVLLHDLRNSWNDNLYMLMGRAYFYKNNLDSAHILFQFVNYAYAPRDPDGYPLPIGSNADGGNAFTVATDEKTGLAKKIFTTPPSRNESFIWQIRTYFQQEKLTRGAVLIEVLKQDPDFPARLQPSLHEMEALWNYKIKQWDSAAYHLTLALKNTANEGETARWEYLIAQLYERSNNPAAAKAWFEKASTNTLDPGLSVYARLNAIRDSKGSGTKGDYIQKNLNALLRMARKEIYQPYLDVIYYVAAEMELERNDKKAARMYYKKCIDHANGLGYNRDRAFLRLGWIFMDDKMYPQAKYAYDSVNTSNPAIADSLKVLLDRKLALGHIVPPILIIERQDSLQLIAEMTPEERDAYIKKMLRAYRKQQGLKEEEDFNGGSAGYGFAGNTPTIDMFSNTGQGDWYFYNQAVKASGYNSFKSKWGNRPNVDNWQVQSLIARQVTALTPASNLVLNGAENPTAAAQSPELTAQKLLEAVPLTPEKMKKSQDSVETAFFVLGKALQDYIPDYRTALKMYDSLERRFPDTRFFQEALFNQYYCYIHLNDSADAERILAMMKQRYPSSRWLSLIINPPRQPEDLPVRTLATRAYENVYEQMIEGNFDEAAKEKLALDSAYGDKYWTPQLLYIEAVYYIHYRYDSIGKVTLNQIITKYSGSQMAAKAKNLLRVLNEREKIENYLRNLHVNRQAEDSIARLATLAAAVKKVDSADMKSKALNVQGMKHDSTQIVIKQLDALQLRAQALFVSPYTWAPDKPHSVVLVMNKVDPVYVTESKNAFDRYDRENFYGKNFETSKESINDSIKLMVIHGFDDAAAALTYLNKAGNAAPREIIPWLPAGRYYFIIIDDQNLEILKANMDMQLYKRFLQVNAPDNFPAGK